MKFAEFLKAPFFTEHLQWLLLTASCAKAVVLIEYQARAVTGKLLFFLNI